MDQIFIRGLRIVTLVGVHRHEKIAPQTVQFDLDIGIANQAVFQSDRIADCIDYSKVIERVTALAGAQHYHLIETLADRVAGLVLREFGAAWVRVSIAKLGVLKNGTSAGVTVERTAIPASESSED